MNNYSLILIKIQYIKLSELYFKLNLYVCNHLLIFSIVEQFLTKKLKILKK